MPSESRIRQILSEFIPRLAPASVGVVSNSAVGRVFYVTNAASNESDTPGGGTSWANPLATIDYAIGQCVAARGDVIMVGPGHTETVIGAAGIDANKAGISIVGCGNGNLRPTITFTTAAGASFDITAANVRVEGLRFICNIDDQTAMMNITANAAVVRDCDFFMGDTTYDAECGILAGNNADYSIVEECRFSSTSSTAITGGAISFGATTYSIIRNNIIYGYFATAGGIVNSAACTDFHVIGNFIVNRTADGDNKAIVLNSSTVGIVANNRGSIIDTNSPAPITAAGAFVAGNYFSSAAGVTASALI